MQPPEDGATVAWGPRCTFEAYMQSWWTEGFSKHVRHLQLTFQARSDDVILVSIPKTGTTWLKAILAELMLSADDEASVLERAEVHLQVPVLDYVTPGGEAHADLIEQAPSPRVYQTHFPHHVLPQSIVRSRCRIVYVTRNPKDTIVSMCKFYSAVKRDDSVHWGADIAVDDMVRRFCRGEIYAGPFHRHVLDYWQAAKEAANPILFLFYEDMTRNPAEAISRIADFVGRPVSSERARVVAERCSLDNAKRLAVNKRPSQLFGFNNSLFYRRGGVGQWREQMSAEASAEVDRYVDEHFSGSGINFTYK